MTIDLFAGYCQKYFEVKDIHPFAKEYLSSWFPLLPSYQTFNLRLNRLNEAFKVLSQRLIDSFVPDDCDFDISLIGSMPIITGGRNREAKRARELVTTGFCSTKNQYYFGLKLHVLAFRKK